jgi:hypothetical protein
MEKSLTLIPGAIVEHTPTGFIFRVLSTTGPIIKCRFLHADIERTFSPDDLRMLAKRERPPITTSHSIPDLIDERPSIVEMVRSEMKKKSRKGRKPKTLLEELAKCDPSDINAILKREGLLT